MEDTSAILTGLPSLFFFSLDKANFGIRISLLSQNSHGLCSKAWSKLVPELLPLPYTAANWEMPSPARSGAALHRVHFAEPGVNPGL